MHILLLGGGWSDEREVSLAGARAIHTALLELGHRVTFLDPGRELNRLPQAAAEADFAFLNLHGKPGEDGLLQGLLEAVGCPYQGAGPGGSALALNKAASKSLFSSAGILTPRWEFLPGPPEDGWTSELGFPAFLKPNTGGSSLGIAMVADETELHWRLEERFALKEEVLLEERIDGMEVTCAVLGQEALPPVLIRPPSQAGFFDYSSKYTPQGAEELCPAPLDDSLLHSVTEIALKVHRLLGLSGYSRTDFLYDGKALYALEVNTLPGMTETSLLPLAARTRGYSFPELVARIIELGMSRADRSEVQPESGLSLHAQAPMNQSQRGVGL
jgi:D-alanine-D-alanine ligase